ncbi:hypothetical protein Tco_0378258 [Tanacetum coccineum]
MAKHKKIYVTPSYTKKVFANIKRQGKDFSGRDTPLFPTMIVQAQEQKGEGSVMSTVPPYTPTINPPSTSKPQKKQYRRTQRKDTEVSQSSDLTKPMADETENVESVPTYSNDQLLTLEIDSLKRRVKKLEKKKGSRTHSLRRLFKGRKIADVEVTLVDEAQGRNDDNLMFDTGCFLDETEVVVKKVVGTAEVTTASATTTNVDDLTLAQTLIEIKAAKPKAVTTAAIITKTAVTRHKARGVVV